MNMEKYLNDNPLALEIRQFFDVSNWSDLMNVSSYSPEDLASPVIDVQLHEKEHANEAQRYDFDKLKDNKLTIIKKLSVLMQTITDKFQFDIKIESTGNCTDAGENVVCLTEKLYKKSFDLVVQDNNKLLKIEKNNLVKWMNLCMETVNKINTDYYRENYLEGCNMSVNYLQCKLNESTKELIKLQNENIVIKMFVIKLIQMKFYDVIEKLNINDAEQQTDVLQNLKDQLLYMENKLHLSNNIKQIYKGYDILSKTYNEFKFNAMLSALAKQNQKIGKDGFEVSDLRIKNVEQEERIKCLMIKHNGEMQRIMQQLEEKCQQMNALENELGKCQGAYNHLKVKYQQCHSELMQRDYCVNELLREFRTNSIEGAIQAFRKLYVYKERTNKYLRILKMFLISKLRQFAQNPAYNIKLQLKGLKKRNILFLQRLEKYANRKEAELKKHMEEELNELRRKNKKITNDNHEFAKFFNTIYQDLESTKIELEDLRKKYNDNLIGFINRINNLTPIKFYINNINLRNMSNDELFDYAISVVQSIVYSKGMEYVFDQLKSKKLKHIQHDVNLGANEGENYLMEDENQTMNMKMKDHIYVSVINELNMRDEGELCEFQDPNLILMNQVKQLKMNIADLTGNLNMTDAKHTDELKAKKDQLDYGDNYLNISIGTKQMYKNKYEIGPIKENELKLRPLKTKKDYQMIEFGDLQSKTIGQRDKINFAMNNTEQDLQVLMQKVQQTTQQISVLGGAGLEAEVAKMTEMLTAAQCNPTTASRSTVVNNTVVTTAKGSDYSTPK